VAAAAVAGRARLAALVALFAGGAAVGAGAAPSTFDFAGAYTHSFPNGTVDGATYTGTDTVTIVAIDARRALFDMELAFFNGHQCTIGGRATLEGDALVYRDPQMTGYGDGGPCTLRFRRTGGRLTWNDDGSCSGYCGARGTLRNGAIAWSSRRALPRAERARFIREHRRTRTLP